MQQKSKSEPSMIDRLYADMQNSREPVMYGYKARILCFDDCRGKCDLCSRAVPYVELIDIHRE